MISFGKQVLELSTDHSAAMEEEDGGEINDNNINNSTTSFANIFANANSNSSTDSNNTTNTDATGASSTLFTEDFANSTSNNNIVKTEDELLFDQFLTNNYDYATSSHIVTKPSKKPRKKQTAPNESTTTKGTDYSSTYQYIMEKGFSDSPELYREQCVDILSTLPFGRTLDGNADANTATATTPIAIPSVYVDPLKLLSTDCSQYPYKLEILNLPEQSRVENQMKLSFKISPPPKHNIMHLSNECVIKQKNYLSADITAYPMELQKNLLYMEAFVICSSTNKPAFVCNRCIKREQRRACRRKSGASDIIFWCNNENRQVVVFNNKQLVMFNSAYEDDEDNCKVFELQTRMVCYCRHHKEPEGFKIIVVVKDYQGTVLAQTVTSNIKLIDKKPSVKKKNSEQKSNSSVNSNSEDLISIGNSQQEKEEEEEEEEEEEKEEEEEEEKEKGETIKRRKEHNKDNDIVMLNNELEDASERKTVVYDKNAPIQLDPKIDNKDKIATENKTKDIENIIELNDLDVLSRRAYSDKNNVVDTVNVRDNVGVTEELNTADVSNFVSSMPLINNTIDNTCVADTAAHINNNFKLSVPKVPMLSPTSMGDDSSEPHTNFENNSMLSSVPNSRRTSSQLKRRKPDDFADSRCHSLSSNASSQQLHNPQFTTNTNTLYNSQYLSDGHGNIHNHRYSATQQTHQQTQDVNRSKSNNNISMYNKDISSNNPLLSYDFLSATNPHQMEQPANTNNINLMNLDHDAITLISNSLAGNVFLNNTTNNSANKNDMNTYLNDPKRPLIQRVIPAQGPINGGIEVTILGSNFKPGMTVKFGPNKAISTNCWSSSTIVTYLPPSTQAGQVLVTVFEPFEEEQNQQYNILGNMSNSNAIFTYVDDTDRQLIELALQIVGLKMNGKLEDARNIAKRIVGNESDHSSNGSTPENNPGYFGGSVSNFKCTSQLLYSDESLILKVIKLLNSSSNISLCNSNGQTLLHLSCLKGYVELVSLLIKKGARTDTKDRFGFTPFHFACINGDSRLLKIFKICRADVKLETVNGYTPRDLYIINHGGSISNNSMESEFYEEGLLILDNNLSRTSSVSSFDSSVLDNEDLNNSDFKIHISRIVNDSFTDDDDGVESDFEENGDESLLAGDDESNTEFPISTQVAEEAGSGSLHDDLLPPQYDDLYPHQKQEGAGKQQGQQLLSSTTSMLAIRSAEASNVSSTLDIINQNTTNCVRPMSSEVSESSDEDYEVMKYGLDKQRQKFKNDKMLIFFWLPLMLVLLSGFIAFKLSSDDSMIHYASNKGSEIVRVWLAKLMLGNKRMQSVFKDAFQQGSNFKEAFQQGIRDAVSGIQTAS